MSRSASKATTEVPREKVNLPGLCSMVISFIRFFQEKVTETSCFKPMKDTIISF